MATPLNILIIDDQKADYLRIREALSQVEGIEIRHASTVADARVRLAAETVDVALIDVCLGSAGNEDGLALVGEVSRTTNTVPIVISSSNKTPQILQAGRLGACHYIFKENLASSPLGQVIERCKQVRDSRIREVSEIVGQSAIMEDVRRKVLTFANRPVTKPILILGPTGSGKGLVAAKIHRASPMRDEPFLGINCGSSSKERICSEIFGHVKGAYTGAYTDRTGAMALVGKGTLFLDETAELEFDAQKALLKAIDERWFSPMGGHQRIEFRGRLIAATNGDLEALIEAGKFREDLLYRLDVLCIRLPGLAERREDIPQLVEHINQKEGHGLRFTQEAMDWLCAQPWRGNVRQLRNVLEKVAAHAGDLVTKEVVAMYGDQRTAQCEPLSRIAREILQIPITDRLDAMERALVEAAMQQANRCIKDAAALLGIHRKALARILARHEDLS
jgi:DNA-binding NtrC family response regulator